MSDKSQRTEKPTKRRMDKARGEGRFLTSRDLVAGLQFVCLVMLLGSYGAQWLQGLQYALRLMLSRAFQPEFGLGDVSRMEFLGAEYIFLPVLAGGGVILLLTLAFQLATTQLGFSMQRLVPTWSKINPISRLMNLPKQNGFAALQMLVTTVLCCLALYAIALRSAEEFYLLPLSPLASSVPRVLGAVQDLLWKAAAVFIIFGCIDYFRQSRRYASEMRMSKQEIKEEYKEMEGHPAIKARIRRLQRALLRRKMFLKVPEASAVIVNPTHFAIAIKYELNSTSAPMVISKGKDHIALRIKKLAIEHGVPLVENPPLAQALYKAVPLNAEIPPHLYRAVAEVLAYVFKVMNRNG